jgi:phosphoglycerol transferase MdoB-like AlkP superfamily enzyme
MKKRLTGLCFYSLFWLFFFIAARLFFLIIQYHSASAFSFFNLLNVFVNGLKLDVSTIGYFLLIPMLLSIPAVFIAGNIYRHIIRFYTYILLIISSLIVVSDANLYTYWGFRIDVTPMLYLKTPGEAFASVSYMTIITSFIIVISFAGLFGFVYYRFIDRLFADLEVVRVKLVGSLLFLILCPALIIPIRGGFGVAPINAGAVYFSPEMFLNHAAINPVWNFGTSFFNRKPVKNPYVFSDIQQAKNSVDSLLLDIGTPEKVLNNSRPNILLIVLESFSSYFVGPLGGDSLVTPNLNRYTHEGILFTNFYASGNRTDKAIPAILSSYPAQPAQSIIKEPKKSQTLPSLIKVLNSNGYKSAFWYGGEINFANFNSYIIGSGFNSIITEDNFDPSTYGSKWGVHDHIMFSAFRDSLKYVSEPFFNVVLTLSSHEPFDVPMEPVFKGDDNITKYKNSVFYTDKALGNFLDWAKETDWWKNTLVILVADHGGRSTDEMAAYSKDIFRIPMLWLGGVLTQKDIKISKLGSQIDISKTLLDQMDIKSDFTFGKDLFSDGTKSFAFYTYNEGFGFITDSSAYFYDHKVKMPVEKYGKDPEYAGQKGKAFLQVLFDDYLKR